MKLEGRLDLETSKIQEDELKRTEMCASCEHMIDCSGMPVEVTRCLSYVPRKPQDENGRRRTWMMNYFSSR